MGDYMDKVLLNSFVKEMLRAHVLHYKYENLGKKSVKEYMMDIATQGLKLASEGKTLHEIFLEIGKKELSPKYKYTLDTEDLKMYKTILGNMKKIAIPGIVKKKHAEEFHYVITSM